LNGRGYTVDDVDWSTTLSLRANYNDVTVTCNMLTKQSCTDWL